MSAPQGPRSLMWLVNPNPLPKSMDKHLPRAPSIVGKTASKIPIPGKHAAVARERIRSNMLVPFRRREEEERRKRGL